MEPADRFEILKKRVGANIKKIRLIRSIEVKKLCLDLQVSPAAYSNIERGITDISMSKLVLLADYFRVSYHQILAFNPLTFDQAEEQVQGAEKNAEGPGEESVEGYLMALKQAREENKFLKEQNNKLLNMLAAQGDKKK